MCLTADNEGTAVEAKTEAIMKVNVPLEQAGLNHSETYQVPDARALAIFTKALRTARHGVPSRVMRGNHSWNKRL